MPTIPPAQLEQALNTIDEQARQAYEIRGVRFSRFRPQLDQIEQAVTDAINVVIDGLTEAECKTITQRIRIRRTQLALKTGVTTEIVGICKQVLAFGIAGIALAVAFIDKIKGVSPLVQKWLAVTGIFYSELLLLSLVVLLMYTLQSRFRYPFLYFRKIGNTWPWFYYGSISNDVPRCVFQLPRQRLVACKLYARDMLGFASRCLGEDKREELRLELRQYFLLIAYQGYVHQFGLRLANCFLYGFSGCILTALLMIAAVYFKLL